MAIFEITLLFLGSVIGAGFATGAEIVTFFGKFQLPIYVISIITGVTMFFIMSWQVLLHTHPNENNIGKLNNNTWIDVVFIMIYLILFTAMTAGIAQITNFWITPISLLLSALIANLNIQKLSHFNTFIVTGITILIVTSTLPLAISTTPVIHFQPKDLVLTCLSAFLYAGLNCFTFPELIHATAQKHQRKTLLWSCLITSIILAILIGLILTAIQAANATDAPIPILAIAATPVTTLMILFAILTSQYTTLFAIIQHTHKVIPQIKNRPRLTMVSICLLAFLGSFCGFNRIIQLGYPLIGIFTCFYLLFSSLRRF